ncbi:hypothetical protein B7486_53940 [cyanobacterium TDX16]|nr:hypothetical protein B7486_53940 [cyanobacterium TDX16]
MHPLRLKTFVSALSGYLLPTGAVILFLLLWMKSQAIDPNRHNRYISNLPFFCHLSRSKIKVKLN